MNPLIIVAHPDNDGSHNRYMFEKAKEDVAHTDYKVIDLYNESFNPVLFQGEPEQKERYQNLLAWSTHIYVIYPIWWNGQPGILKGFFDKVIEPGFAFKFDQTFIPKVGWPRGFLAGRRAAVLTTTGSPKLMHYIYQARRGIKLTTKDTLGFAGVTTKSFHVGGAQKLTENNKRRLDRAVAKATNWLFS